MEELTYTKVGDHYLPSWTKKTAAVLFRQLRSFLSFYSIPGLCGAAGRADSAPPFCHSALTYSALTYSALEYASILSFAENHV